VRLPEWYKSLLWRAYKGRLLRRDNTRLGVYVSGILAHQVNLELADRLLGEGCAGRDYCVRVYPDGRVGSACLYANAPLGARFRGWRVRCAMPKVKEA